MERPDFCLFVSVSVLLFYFRLFLLSGVGGAWILNDKQNKGICGL